MDRVAKIARLTAGTSLLCVGGYTALVGASPLFALYVADVVSGGRVHPLTPDFMKDVLRATPMLGMMLVGYGINLLDPQHEALT